MNIRPTTGTTAQTASGSASRGQLEAAVEQVYARPEFADLSPAEPGIWTQINRWIAEMMSGVGEALHELPPWVLWLVLGWMVLTLLAIFAHLVWVLLPPGTWRPRSGASARPGGGSPDELGMPEWTFEAAQQQADRLQQAGRWAEAMRYLYVASLLWLDRGGLVVFRPSKTEADYRRELAERPVARRQWATLAEGFERVTYGGAEATRAYCHQMRQAAERMRHELGANPAG